LYGSADPHLYEDGGFEEKDNFEKFSGMIDGRWDLQKERICD